MATKFSIVDERAAWAIIRDIVPTWVTLDLVGVMSTVKSTEAWILAVGDDHILVSDSIGGRKERIRKDDILAVVIGGRP